VGVEGRVKVVRVLSITALVPKYRRLEPGAKVTLVSRLFPSKATSPMVWTLEGISIDLSFAAWKALAPISTRAEFDAKVIASRYEVFRE
jgi:hypothetical protein